MPYNVCCLTVLALVCERCDGTPNLSDARRERGNQIFGANPVEAVAALTVTAGRGTSGSEPVS
ncbi:MAG: hypothetical protein SLRJCFUN_001775 [Candidatus Fervidibacter sp.]